MAMYYKLDDNVNAVPTDDMLEGWNSRDKAVLLTSLDNGYQVSSVFLVIDHDGMLFETAIIFNGEIEVIGRKATFSEIKEAHDRVVDIVKGFEPKKYSLEQLYGSFIN